MSLHSPREPAFGGATPDHEHDPKGLSVLVDPITWQDKPVPRRRWIVEQWIPHGSVTLLTGDGGVGKSLLAQMLITSCALDRQWLGLPTIACKAIGVFCEDEPDELIRRQAAINEAFDVEMGDLERMKMISRVGYDNVLVEYGADGRAATTAFYDQLLGDVRAFGAQVIVIDTATDTYGGNENIRPQVRQFINLLQRFAIECDGAVVLTAHPSNTGISTGSGVSGSTAWSNTVRSRLYLDRQKDTEQRTLRRMKANYAAMGDDVRVEWVNGVFRRVDGHDGLGGTITRKTADVAFIECLDALVERQTPISDKSRSGNYAPKQMTGMPEAEGFSLEDLRLAMERLFHRGAIKNERYGPPSKGWTKIVRA